jgi:hypothetical protein
MRLGTTIGIGFSIVFCLVASMKANEVRAEGTSKFRDVFRRVAEMSARREARIENLRQFGRA